MFCSVFLSKAKSPITKIIENNIFEGMTYRVVSLFKFRNFFYFESQIIIKYKTDNMLNP